MHGDGNVHVPHCPIPGSFPSKPARRLIEFDPRYVGFNIEDYFVVGYDSEDGEDFIPVLKFDNPHVALEATDTLQSWYNEGVLL